MSAKDTLETPSVLDAKQKRLYTEHSMEGLIRYDAMCLAIAECHRVDEVKDIRDRARAFEVYAKQALNLDAERKAAEIRIRAERKAGVLLKEMKDTGQRQKPGGDRKKSKSRDTTLKDLGITRDQSSKWQQLADIPAEEFEAEMSKPGPPISTEGLLNSRTLAANPMPRIDPQALRAWGRIKDFERAECGTLLESDLFGLFQGMTEPMKDDLIRLAPVLIEWLEGFIRSRKRSVHGSNGTAYRDSAR
jgi:hypothetical protein